MKFLLVLCLSVALSFSQDYDQYDGYDNDYEDELVDDVGGNWMMQGLSEMLSQIDFSSILDNSTESGLNMEVQIGLQGLKMDMCPDPSSECIPAYSMFMGCNCINGFKSLREECRSFPCEVHKYLYTELASVLTELSEVETMEDMASWFMDKMWVPLMESLCNSDCGSDIISGFLNCVENYDGAVMTMMEGNISEGYRTFMSQMNFTLIESVMNRMLAVHCAKVDNEFCFYSNSQSVKEFVRMIELSFEEDSEEDCGNFKRVGDEFWAYMDTYNQDWTSAVMEIESEDSFIELTSMVGNVIEAYYNLTQKTWCDEECVNVLVKKFYSCCAVKQGTLASDPELSKDFVLIIKNIIEIVNDGEVEYAKLKETNRLYRLYSRTFSPLKLCRNAENDSYMRYRKVARKCRRKSIF